MTWTSANVTEVEATPYPAGDSACSTSAAQFLARELAHQLCSRVTPSPASPGAEYARVNAIPLSVEQAARFAATLELGILQHLDGDAGPALVAYQGVPTPILQAAIDAADARSNGLGRGPLTLWSYQVFTDRLMSRSHHPIEGGDWRTLWPAQGGDPDSRRRAAASRSWDAAWRWAQAITGWHRATHPAAWSPITDDQATTAELIIAMSIRQVAGQQQPLPAGPVEDARVSLAHLPTGYAEAEQVMAAPLTAIEANLADPAASDALLAVVNQPPEMHARDRFGRLQAWPSSDRHRVVGLAHQAVAALHAAGPTDATLASRCSTLAGYTTG
jgi:hypothetical protein